MAHDHDANLAGKKQALMRKSRKVAESELAIKSSQPAISRLCCCMIVAGVIGEVPVPPISMASVAWERSQSLNNWIRDDMIGANRGLVPPTHPLCSASSGRSLTDMPIPFHVMISTNLVRGLANIANACGLLRARGIQCI